MYELLNNHKRLFWIALILLTIFVVGVVVCYGGPRIAKRAIFDNERLLVESPTMRTVLSISVSDGRKAIATGESVPLVGGQLLVVEGGKTLKEAYSLAESDALAWNTDAKLVYVRSLGTVTIEGVSSGWEIAFGSKEKKKGYLLAVINGAISEKNEITSSSFGYSLPENWYDAGEAIKSIQTLPQFRDATISGINFYYNEDGKRWGYALATSNGTVSIPVR